MAESDELHDWCDLADAGWRSMFLGNGISINISSGFAYGKLYDRASLSPAAQKLFADYETTNFELVLERLADTARMMRTFAFPITQEQQIQREYEGIRQALFDGLSHACPSRRDPRHDIGANR